MHLTQRPSDQQHLHSTERIFSSMRHHRTNEGIRILNAWGCRPYSSLPLAVTNDIRHQPACDQLQLLGLRQLGLQLLSEGNSR
jgi:hypothetical protein